jgi:predicted GTPase
MTSLVAAMESEGLLSEKIFVPNANFVLVMGATGVGKSYFVNSVHGSPRSWESSLLAPGEYKMSSKHGHK